MTPRKTPCARAMKGAEWACQKLAGNLRASRDSAEKMNPYHINNDPHFAGAVRIQASFSSLAEKSHRPPLPNGGFC